MCVPEREGSVCVCSVSLSIQMVAGAALFFLLLLLLFLLEWPLRPTYLGVVYSRTHTHTTTNRLGMSEKDGRSGKCKVCCAFLQRLFLLLLPLSLSPSFPSWGLSCPPLPLCVSLEWATALPVFLSLSFSLVHSSTYYYRAERYQGVPEHIPLPPPPRPPFLVPHSGAQLRTTNRVSPC